MKNFLPTLLISAAVILLMGYASVLLPQSGTPVRLTNVATDAAESATVSSNPVPAGCVNETAFVTISNNEVAYLKCSTLGILFNGIIGAPNLNTLQVSVTSSATSILSARATRTRVSITQTGTTPLFCGNSAGVTTATGDFMAGSVGYSISYTTTSAIFCISSGPSQTVTVAETYY